MRPPAKPPLLSSICPRGHLRGRAGICLTCVREDQYENHSPLVFVGGIVAFVVVILGFIWWVQ